MRLVMMAIAVLFAAACTQPAPMAVEPAKPVVSAPQPASTEAACKTQGGDWHPICLMGKPACVISYKDAGKACTDGSQCGGGRCYTSGAKPDAPAQGQCAATSDPCGCRQTVENGKAGYPLCVD